MTERELQDAVVQLARLLGYLVCHFRPARTGTGWRTPLQGDAGFPDVVMAGHGRVIFAELKVGGGVVTSPQQAWLMRLAQDGVEAYVWTDKDWLSGLIERMLRSNPGRAEAEFAAARGELPARQDHSLGA